MKKILVLCTGNSCRSQIAEGYLRHFCNGRAEVFSAGIETHGVNPKAIETMAADGINIANHTSNHIKEYEHINFDFLITVCDHANQNCPVLVTNAQKLHHNFPDPAKAAGTDEEIKQEFAAVRDQIKEYCENFVEQYLKNEPVA